MNEDDNRYVVCLSHTKIPRLVLSVFQRCTQVIEGSLPFYEAGLEAVGLTMHDIQQTHISQQIYAMFCEQMSLKEKESARQCSKVDTRVLTALFAWLIEENGHPSF